MVPIYSPLPPLFYTFQVSFSFIFHITSNLIIRFQKFLRYLLDFFLDEKNGIDDEEIPEDDVFNLEAVPMTEVNVIIFRLFIILNFQVY